MILTRPANVVVGWMTTKTIPVSIRSHHCSLEWSNWRSRKLVQSLLQNRRSFAKDHGVSCTNSDATSGISSSIDDDIHDHDHGWMQLSEYLSSSPSKKDWNDQMLHHSPVETRILRGRKAHIKRDDLLSLKGSRISGNKARKMLSLNSIPASDFPQCLVSYGGPQSNSMLALASIVASKNHANNATQSCRNEPSRFVYYTKSLPKFLRKQPNGNLKMALDLGMELVEVAPPKYKNLFGGDWGGDSKPPTDLNPPVPSNSLWVPQGGAFDGAQDGAKQLASELFQYWSQVGCGRPLTVYIPGGTCTTAALTNLELQKIFLTKGEENDIQVIVIPCVGDVDYAKRQMTALLKQVVKCDDAEYATQAPPIPEVIRPALSLPTDSQQQEYFKFAEPHAEVLATFQELKAIGLEVDLVYGAPSWTILFRHWTKKNPGHNGTSHDSVDGTTREILYVHSGGLEGIASQLQRYKFKGLA